ncbi:hypothetical protein [Blautia sp. 1033sp1_1033st1_G9_1033SCRN_220408]|uniref:hypothetical protein n=1 Tax=Blautia sp. 1033sp1_1033st1_G9_1033SCRN_220408 TaxID=3144490 RepID=UPI0034A5D14E
MQFRARYSQMLGAKNLAGRQLNSSYLYLILEATAPNYDILRLLRATHSNNPAGYHLYYCLL